MSENIERIAPGIRMEDGSHYEPKGWEWILGFALHGCKWAIEEASKPDFRQKIIDDLKANKRESLQCQIDLHLKKAEELKEELRISNNG